MALIQRVYNELPTYWYPGSGDFNGRFIISSNSDEFDKVLSFVTKHVRPTNYEIKSVNRVQNVISYGRFLLRQEQLATYDTPTFMKRKMVLLDESLLRVALKYNLDARRLSGTEIRFVDNVRATSYLPNYVLLIVNTLHQCVEGAYGMHGVGLSNEHYVEYVVDFQ